MGTVVREQRCRYKKEPKPNFRSDLRAVSSGLLKSKRKKTAECKRHGGGRGCQNSEKKGNDRYGDWEWWGHEKGGRDGRVSVT